MKRFDSKENEEIVVKKFLNPESAYDDRHVSYTISSDDMFIDGEQTSTDLDASFSLGSGRNNLVLSFFTEDEEGVKKALDEIDQVINALSDFRLDLLKVTSKYPPHKTEKEETE